MPRAIKKDDNDSWDIEKNLSFIFTFFVKETWYILEHTSGNYKKVYAKMQRAFEYMLYFRNKT